MRQIRDYFYHKAKQEKYPARSVYKLEEIDNKCHILKKGQRVLDLGSSPGSWIKYCSKKVGSPGLVVGIDKKTLNIKAEPHTVFIQGDILKLDQAQLRQISPQFDVVLSDLAPATTGTRLVDQARSLELAQKAWSLAKDFLVPGGHFVCKLFQGPDINELRDEMRQVFGRVKLIKPKSSRSESFELFLVGQFFRK